MVIGDLDFKVDFKLDFKMDFKMDYRGDIREYFEESIFLAFEGSRQVRWTYKAGKINGPVLFKDF